jgi:glycosyltransferase involved in cell wall biosynthesis
MDFLQNIDVLIITRNEEANLARTLEVLRRFPRVIVLDSGSTDGTLQIAANHANVRVCSHDFDSHAAQWTHGLQACGLTAPWVLALDADYVLDAALVDEIAALAPPTDVGGFRASFRYCINGRALSGSLYPPVVILFRREGASFAQDGHAHRLIPVGRVQPLHHLVSHDDRKPFSAWLAAQDRYARLECELLRNARWADVKWADRIRKLVVVAPWFVPLYCLTLRRGLLDGRAGLLYAVQRGIAEAILSAHLIDAGWGRSSKP